MSRHCIVLGPATGLWGAVKLPGRELPAPGGVVSSDDHVANLAMASGYPMTETVQRRKIFQEVFDRLMERIRSGAIPAGAQLPSERELMDEYGVGRPAVREALQALERSGIVEIIHGERARVVVPTADHLVAQLAGGAMHLLRSQPGSLEHMKEARLFLECGTARMGGAARYRGAGGAAAPGDCPAAVRRGGLRTVRRARHGVPPGDRRHQRQPDLSVHRRGLVPAGPASTTRRWCGRRAQRNSPSPSMSASLTPSRPMIPTRPRRQCTRI